MWLFDITEIMYKTLLYRRKNKRDTPKIATELLLRNPRLLDIIETEYGLLDKLYSCRALCEQQIELIRTEAGRTGALGAVRILLEEVNKMSREQQEEFLSALVKTHQSHVANYIRNNGQKPETEMDNWPLYLYKQRNTIREKWSELKENIDSRNGLLDELFAVKCIDRRQKQYINDVTEHVLKNDRLLGILLKRSFGDYKKFIHCLLKTKQCHVVSMLEPSDDRAVDCRPLTEQQKLQLETNYTTVVDLLDCNVRLLMKLHAVNCITKRQKEFIECASQPSESNGRLLDMVSRGSQSDFDKFVECLKETGQSHVSSVLLSEGAATDMIAKTSGSVNLPAHEMQAVNQFMSVMSISASVNRQLMLEIVKDYFEQLETRDVQLVAMQPNHSIRLFYVCGSLSGLLFLSELYVSGKLKSIVQQIVNASLDGETFVTISRLKWNMSGYSQCAQYLFKRHGMSVYSQIYQLAQLQQQQDEPSVSAFPIDRLPHELVELLLKKAASQLFQSMKNLTSQASILSLITLHAVCLYWWEALTYQARIKRSLKQYFIQCCAPYRFIPNLVNRIRIPGEGTIVGIAGFRSKLYLVSSASNKIQVLQAGGSSFCERGHDIRVPELNWPADIAACSETKFLFVSDYKMQCVWRINLNLLSTTSSDEKIEKIEKFIDVDYEPFKLSVKSSRLLVTARDGTALYLYSCVDGELIKVVKQPDYIWARDAVATSDGTLIVCFKTRWFGASERGCRPGLSELSYEGNVLRVFTDAKEFSEPIYVSVDSMKHILVCDRRNKEVVHLNRELQLKHVVLTERELSGQPYRLYYCEEKGLLYISYYTNSQIDVYKVGI